LAPRAVKTHGQSPFPHKRRPHVEMMRSFANVSPALSLTLTTASISKPSAMTVTTQQVGVNVIAEIFSQQKKFFRQTRTEPLKNRKERLRKLKNWIHANRHKIHEAAFRDFQKAPQEVDGIEIFHVLNEVKFALGNLEEWASPKKVDAPITMLGTRSYIQYEPRGVCLIISPWNYPFSLAVGPLVSALAAGNVAILKPSEMTPNVSALLKNMASELFEPAEVFVIEGDAQVSQQLLALPFDHIFFTGSPAVGKMVMKAAAENLTSVTLELGGKSPAFVSSSADLDDAAERIAVAKFVNNGQTCVAPDYLLVEETVKDRLIKKIIEKTTARFFQNSAPEKSGSYCRIVNDKHFKRIASLVEDAIIKGATVEWDGPHDATTRFMHPVILSNIHPDSILVSEEIFGPVLPVMSYTKLEEAIAIVNEKPKPLSLYIFSKDKFTLQKILNETSAGGVCINDCGIHFLHHNLPFGGVNSSGIGKSHGHFGFLAFSHEKGVLKQKSGLTTFRPFYPPYTTASRKLMDWFLKLF
jgi:aldehyde dehydrogenase (NAD+)